MYVFICMYIHMYIGRGSKSQNFEPNYSLPYFGPCLALPVFPRALWVFFLETREAKQQDTS